MIDSRLLQIAELPDASHPASAEALEALQEELGLKLPVDFIEFVQRCNGYAGEGGALNMRFYAVEDMISTSENYGVDVGKEQVVYFGDNWGDCAFAFDFRYHRIQIIKTPLGEVFRSDFVYYGETLSGFLDHWENGTMEKRPGGLKKRPVFRKPVKTKGDGEEGLLKVLRAHGGQVEDVAFSPDGGRALSLGPGKRLIIWDTDSWKKSYIASDSAWPNLPGWYSGDLGMVGPVVFAPDGESLLFRSYDMVEGMVEPRCRISQVNPRTGTCDRLFQSDELGSVRKIHFSPDGQWMLTEHPANYRADNPPTLGLWSFVTGELVRGHIGVKRRYHTPSAFSPDGSHYVYIHEEIETSLSGGVSSQHSVCMVETISGKETLRILSLQEDIPHGLFFTSDGRLLSASYGRCGVIDLATGVESDLITCPDTEVENGCRMLGKSSIVCGTSGGRMSIFDAGSGEEIWLGESERSAVDRFAVSPDGRQALSGGYKKGSLYVWHFPE